MASQNLDVARLNFLQATFDALVARSAYERSTGIIADPTRMATTTGQPTGGMTTGGQ